MNWFDEVGAAYPEYKKQKLSWWIRFCLFFKPSHAAIDFAGNTSDVVVFYKYLRGKIYIVGESRWSADI